MRTTLSLDDDVAALLEKVRKAKGLSFKQAVNEALRVGLRHLTTRTPHRSTFHTGKADLGRCLIGTLDDVSEALAIENGFLLCSTDRDFSRFPGLRWENPLETV
jgi:hypothetical protein